MEPVLLLQVLHAVEDYVHQAEEELDHVNRYKESVEVAQEYSHEASGEQVNQYACKIEVPEGGGELLDGLEVLVDEHLLEVSVVLPVVQRRVLAEGSVLVLHHLVSRAVFHLSKYLLYIYYNLCLILKRTLKN